MQGAVGPSRLAWGLLWIVAAAAAGCDARLTVRQYPSFYDPQLKTVAVVPFANQTLNGRAGDFLAERLADALKANGTYRVTGPRELRSALFQAGLTLPPDPDAAAWADALRKLGGAQAFLFGTVRSFSADRSSYTVVDYDWDYGPGYGHWHHGYWYGHRYGYAAHYPVYRHYSYAQAYVAVEASLVNVSDGVTIHATPAPVAARLRSGDGPIGLADELLKEAADAAAARLVEVFAVVPVQIRIDKGKTLRIARRRADGPLEFTDDFRADDESMLVIVALPPQADRNVFRAVIARPKDHRVLAEEQFTWSAGDAPRELQFDPRALTNAAGTGKFEVRLFSGDQFVLKRSFEIDK